MELIIDFFKSMDYLGPNCKEESVKVINSLSITNKNIKIADIGCGTGRPTEILANELNGKIIAIDLAEEFLEPAKKRFNDKNLNIETSCQDMGNLNFDVEEFDLIYSEGSIYNIGFEKGINYWKKFIKLNGYLVVAEISWLTEKRPKKIQEYWDYYYKEIDTCENKIKQLKKAGYKVIKHFIVPPKCWENYYNHVEKYFNPFLKKHEYSKEAIEFIEEFKTEMDIYNEFNDYFSYVFYIAQRIV